MLTSVLEETDDGPRGRTARTALSRLCLATRAVTPVDQMLRFVVGPDGKVVPDLAARLPGRGAWVSSTRAALEAVLKKKAFGRAFKGKGTVDAGLPDLVEDLLNQDARAYLSLVNKAGRAVTGAAKVESALSSGETAVLLHASDARPDGVRKLNARARQVQAAGAPEVIVVDCFEGEELDLALGRSNVVHAALLAHPTTAGFLARCRKLERWRTGRSDGAPEGHGLKAGPTPDRMQGTDTE